METTVKIKNSKGEVVESAFFPEFENVYTWVRKVLKEGDVAEVKIKDPNNGKTFVWNINKMWANLGVVKYKGWFDGEVMNFAVVEHNYRGIAQTLYFNSLTAMVYWTWYNACSNTEFEYHVTDRKTGETIKWRSENATEENKNKKTVREYLDYVDRVFRGYYDED